MLPWAADLAKSPVRRSPSKSRTLSRVATPAEANEIVDKSILTLDSHSEIDTFWTGVMPGWGTAPIAAITHPSPLLMRQPIPKPRTPADVLSALATREGERDAIPPPASQDPAISASLANTLSALLTKPSDTKPENWPVQEEDAGRKHFEHLLPTLMRFGYKASGLSPGSLPVILGKVDKVLAPIMKKEMPSLSLNPHHPQYLWYLMPVLAYLSVQNRSGDLETATILSLLTPAPVIDIANIVDSPKKTAAPSNTAVSPMPPVPSSSPPPDFTHSLLVWVNQQPPEKWESLERAFHLALMTAQVAPPGFSYQGSLEHWTMLSTLPKTEALTQAVMQFWPVSRRRKLMHQHTPLRARLKTETNTRA